MKELIKILSTIAVFFLLAIFGFGQDTKSENCFIILEVEFLKTGKIGTIEVFSRACGKNLGLEEKAKEAAKKIKFKPKKENGEAITIIKKVRFDFKFSQSKEETKEDKNKRSISIYRQIVILDKPHAAYPNPRGGTVNVRGTVRLRVEFLSTGEIGEIAVVSRLPYAVDNAIKAARKMNFIPMHINGIPISKKASVAYRFSVY